MHWPQGFFFSSDRIWQIIINFITIKISYLPIKYQAKIFVCLPTVANDIHATLTLAVFHGESLTMNYNTTQFIFCILVLTWFASNFLQWQTFVSVLVNRTCATENSPLGCNTQNNIKTCVCDGNLCNTNDAKEMNTATVPMNSTADAVTTSPTTNTTTTATATTTSAGFKVTSTALCLSTMLTVLGAFCL